MTHMRRNGIRATAMTELVFCMLPYLLVLLAALFFWHLMLGKQEVIKYTASTAMPGQGAIESDWFIGKLEGKATLKELTVYSFGEGASESTFNDLAKVTEDDEPVLPYKSNGDDFKRAIELAGVSVYYSQADGGYRLSLGETGWRLKTLGFLDADTKKVYSEAEDISVTVSQTELLEDASQAMGEWIQYRGCSGSNYSYTAPFGLDKLPFESEKPDNREGAWRSSYGISVFKDFPGAFWPAIEDTGMRSWTGYQDLTTSITAIFSPVFSKQLSNVQVSDSDSMQHDKSVIPSYSN